MDFDKIEFDKIEFNTGDIILLQDKQLYSILDYLGYAIQLFTWSKYSHVGMVVKDPIIHDKKREGLYFLESTAFDGIKDIDDDKTKFGVQIVPLKERLKKSESICYYRKLNVERTETFNQLYNRAYTIVKDKPYDINPTDWFKSEFDIKKGKVEKMNTFFCSALVSYLLVALTIIPQDSDWTIMRPKDLGTEMGCRLDIPILDREIKINIE